MSAADLSVIMPVYNGCERWIADAITSVLDRADGLLELVVVDDGCTDTSIDIAGEFGDPVRIVEQPHSGLATARNTGVAAARGELIGWLDADDIWVAKAPDPRRPYLASGEADVVLGRVQPVYGEPPVPMGDTMAGVQLGAMLARPAAITDLGGFDTTPGCAEDLDLLLRMRDSGTAIKAIDDVTVHYRQRAGSITQNREAINSAMVKAIHASMKRRAAG